MPGIIKTKYPGFCSDCGAAMPVGVMARYYGRGVMYGMLCHPQIKKADIAAVREAEKPPKPQRATKPVKTPTAKPRRRSSLRDAPKLHEYKTPEKALDAFLKLCKRQKVTPYGIGTDEYGRHGYGIKESESFRIYFGEKQEQEQRKTA